MTSWEDTVVLVQARMGSRRLPGKSLQLIAGKPLLQHLIDNLLQVTPRTSLKLLTSTNKEDDALSSFAQTIGISCVRGHPTNVAQRFFDALQQEKAKYFIRISGDSPLLDQKILQQVRTQMLASPATMITTAGESPFPSGMNVEILDRQEFLKAFPLFSAPDHFEHVTRYFYEKASHGKVRSIQCSVPLARNYKFTVDTAEDAERMNRLITSLGLRALSATLEEKCEAYNRLLGASK